MVKSCEVEDPLGADQRKAAVEGVGQWMRSETDVSGIGGTLTGNALALAAMRATLDSTLLADDYARMVPLARRWADGVRDAFTDHALPWSVNQLGARAEYWFSPPPRNGAGDQRRERQGTGIHRACIMLRGKHIVKASLSASMQVRRDTQLQRGVPYVQHIKRTTHRPTIPEMVEEDV